MLRVRGRLLAPPVAVIAAWLCWPAAPVADARASAAAAPITNGKRPFPDTSARIGIFADQLPGNVTVAQRRFAATHYVGTQKLTRDLAQALRAINPGFLVLHYHLAMWQSAPRNRFIVDGIHWSNDFATVTTHESWFWHDQSHQRVSSRQDGKFLMNVSDPGFQAYWRESIAQQVEAGDYDGVFLDSASPALLQWEARVPVDRRLLGEGVRSTFAELGGSSWIAAWQAWIAGLDAALAKNRIALIPNVGALTTSWDDTDYSLTAGAFVEGFCDPRADTSDWEAAVGKTLALVRRHRIVILENTLPSADDLGRRRYLFGSYLLVKGEQTYLDYFASTPLEWYPEWNLDLGAGTPPARTLGDLRWRGVYRRDFANGAVLVNPTTSRVFVDLGGTFRRVEPRGGGPVPQAGTEPGEITTRDVTTLDLPPRSAEILLRKGR